MSVWRIAQGDPPPPNGDSRKLVWLVDKEGMAWIGIRFYRGDKGEWYVNDREESATVTHWMDLPEPPQAPSKAEELPLGHEFRESPGRLMCFYPLPGGAEDEFGGRYCGQLESAHRRKR